MYVCVCACGPARWGTYVSVHVCMQLYLIIVQGCKFVNLINLRLYLSRAPGTDWHKTRKVPSRADREVAHRSHSSLRMSSPMAMLQKLIEEVQV